jgi:D-3-phosphoglycerate dehydrogenase
MGVKILAYDKYLKGFGSKQVEECSWDQIFNHADILSFHVPLTKETEGYFDATCLNQFKKPIYLLNLSRGKVVETSALIEGLKIGKVQGCALDVLENEDIKSLKREELDNFEYLINSEKVVLTPHIGGWTKESYHKISSVLLDKLLTFSPKK